MDIIVGTAGHIDHGKTALIKALTGVDADRLPEEKRRGITVDLGFAEMSVGEAHFGFVDVPGHERFVKNMLAGASGIDIVMLVIAADEGVMPQTREHFDICRLLGIESGVIVLTKKDLVDDETLALARLETDEMVANSFLENAPRVAVSSRTGDGIDVLRQTLVDISSSLQRADDQLVARLPIDRSFSVKGFGAVVTGTMASGKFLEAAEVELLPAGTKVRVRGLQTHCRSAQQVGIGQRVAINLGGIDHSKVTRGMVLSETDILRPTQIFDAEVEVLPSAKKSLRSRQRVRVHAGTIEALARIQILNETGEIAAGKKDFAQIRLESPVVVVPGERFIVRSYSPQITIGGGVVIDTFAPKHRRREIENVRQYLRSIHAFAGDNVARVSLIVGAAGRAGLSFSDLHARTALKRNILRAAIDANAAVGDLVNADGQYISRKMFDDLSELVESAVADFHRREPLERGMSREALREKVFAHLPARIFQSAIASLESAGKVTLDKETIRLSSYRPNLSEAEVVLSSTILTRYRDARLEVPKLEDALADAIEGTNFSPQTARKFFQIFLDSGEIVKVTDDFYFARNAIDELIASLRQVGSGTDDRTIDVARFKDLAGISRKYAIPLLEYFDREKVTRRVGDKRVIL